MPSSQTAELPPIEGQKATIIGLAREGTALARYLARHGAQVLVSDVLPAERLSEQLDSLVDTPVELALGGHPPEVLDADAVYVSPGVPPDMPILAQARRSGIRLSSATELFFERCPGADRGHHGLQREDDHHDPHR